MTQCESAFRSRRWGSAPTKWLRGVVPSLLSMVAHGLHLSSGGLGEKKPMSTAQPCRICRATEWEVAFGGPVRDGTFGKTRPGTVHRCRKCGVEFLPPVQE